MAVVVAGLEVFGDVGECGEILRVLGCTGDVTDLMLGDDVLSGENERENRLRHKTVFWIQRTQQKLF